MTSHDARAIFMSFGRPTETFEPIERNEERTMSSYETMWTEIQEAATYSPPSTTTSTPRRRLLPAVAPALTTVAVVVAAIAV